MELAWTQQRGLLGIEASDPGMNVTEPSQRLWPSRAKAWTVGCVTTPVLTFGCGLNFVDRETEARGPRRQLLLGGS